MKQELCFCVIRKCPCFVISFFHRCAILSLPMSATTSTSTSYHIVLGNLKLLWSDKIQLYSWKSSNLPTNWKPLWSPSWSFGCSFGCRHAEKVLIHRSSHHMQRWYPFPNQARNEEKLAKPVFCMVDTGSFFHHFTIIYRDIHHNNVWTLSLSKYLFP